MRRTLFAVGLCGLLATTGVPASHAVDVPESPPLPATTHPPKVGAMISVDGDLLSVSVDDAPWDVVAKEIAHRMGVEVHIRGQVRGTVTRHFERVPVDDAMRRLFQGTNHLLFYASQPSPRSPRLASIWLLSTHPPVDGDGRHASSSEGALSSDDVDPAAPRRAATHEGSRVGAPDHWVSAGDTLEFRLARLAALSEANDRHALQRAVFDPDPILQMAALDFLAGRDARQAVSFLLRTAKRAELAEERLQAVTLLHQTRHADEGTIVSALVDALADEAAIVKGYAIQALAERGGADALRALGALMIDGDVAARTMVIAYVNPTGDGSTLLRYALSDEDESLRAAAAARLAGTPER